MAGTLITLIKYKGKYAGERKTQVYKHIYDKQMAIKKKFAEENRKFRTSFEDWIPEEEFDQLMVEETLEDKIIEARLKRDEGTPGAKELPEVTTEDELPSSVDGGGAPNPEPEGAQESRKTLEEVKKLKSADLKEYAKEIGIEFEDTARKSDVLTLVEATYEQA